MLKKQQLKGCANTDARERRKHCKRERFEYGEEKQFRAQVEGLALKYGSNMVTGGIAVCYRGELAVALA